MRRAVALIVLLVSTVSQAEAVVGELRDGDVHHESSAEAWVHSHDPHGAHAHDSASNDIADVSGDEDPSEHEHGSSSDHCTHVHGTPVASSAIWCLTPVEISLVISTPFSAFDVPSEAHSPPPRA